VRIASPELVFLQLARELSVQQLILLGLQMCSHAPMQANKALTTRRKLELFLAKTEGHRGHRKAARAVQYLANGSNSIMESFTYMFLTLPSALGGFGLKGATFNHEVTLNAESRRSLLQRSVFTDLYYEKAKVAVEYQSLAHHQGEGRKGHDTLRITALALHGIEVFQLSPYQIFSESDLKGFARTLASRLGMRIRERSEKFEQMHRQLHGLLESVARRPSEALPVRAGAVIR
jgi:very-short-patch-repair endonuclease